MSKRVHILAPNIPGGVKNFCIDFAARLDSRADVRKHFYSVDFTKKSSDGLKIGAKSKTKEQAAHVWKELQLHPSDIIVSNDGRELLWVGASAISNPLIYIMHGDNKSYHDAIALNGNLCSLIVFINPGIHKEYIRQKNWLSTYYLPQLFKGSKTSQRELNRLKSQNTKPRITFIGRDTKAKGFDILQSALEMFPDYAFEVILSGAQLNPENYSACTNVTYHINITHAEVLHVLERSSHLFFPSRKEGLPLSILEALSCGCTVSCLNLPGFKDAFLKMHSIQIFDDHDALITNLAHLNISHESAQESIDDANRWQMSSERGLEKLGILIENLTPTKRTKRRYQWRDWLPL